MRLGNWNPENDTDDRDHRNALAARGYWQAFQRVRQSIEQVLLGENAGTVADSDHATWYRELFGPGVTVGIMRAADLAGYRNGPVYIRRSKHTPHSDGNGRMGRFMMNLMLASGGYPWIVVPLARHDDYMAALESASVEGNIVPFAELLAELERQTRK